MPAGRPPLFKTPEELEKVANDYFKWADENPWIKKDAIRGGERAGEIISIPIQRPYTLIAMCHHIGINTDTWYLYEKREEFIAITTQVHNTIRNQKLEGATVGIYNSNIIARELGLSDKQEHTVHTEQPMFTPIK